MSSNTIYQHTAGDRTPYTYLIGWTHLDIWYYGRRTAINCHPDEFWVEYFTSSEKVRDFRIDNGEPDYIKIDKIFSDINETVDYEILVLKFLDAKHNPMFLNGHNGDGNGYMANMAVYRNIITNKNE